MESFPVCCISQSCAACKGSTRYSCFVLIATVTLETTEIISMEASASASDVARVIAANALPSSSNITTYRSIEHFGYLSRITMGSKTLTNLVDNKRSSSETPLPTFAILVLS
ncbi:uncharacterized protein Gasu_10090 [Galdieria sulphuraria]|uniref:Uncharacterized protein n=1 Tax=Galdieria sulphuraria TaxID=130081 RepID=M2Y7Y8_GALSU|nr:uncharacterized protein Gasu_10090 [Galdieria sulphuraria]EME31944.1 hypothetical protein Gasu_10090 [Galdieria sulphuraria]|eukprot:XP_005708464.1 hypothetical protein Gasu_10090 [Galdieria sulphuraria]